MEVVANDVVTERVEGAEREGGTILNDNSNKSGEMLQIVDFEGNFSPNFDRTFARTGLTRCGFEFNVITVLGCQSSGKSTLLNSMFGTSFPEMNSLLGRSRTTLGIWAAKDTRDNTLIIDVEGTDSKERGEDRLTFEHRASLFSLAVADAVIVNMWYYDLGRYTASNYGLLKTVLAVNLELFNHEPGANKTTLIFVIRDHSPAVTPLKLLEQMLYKDLLEIWKEIKKPTELARATVDDFFDFVVIGLPSKVASFDLYEKAVAEFRHRWTHEIKPREYSRSVPADGFPYYAQQVWQTIMDSNELDIPSQKEMVATYRCEEIRRQTLDAVLPVIHLAAHDPSSLFNNGVAETCIKRALRMYHHAAWRYSDSVYQMKMEQLLDSLFVEIQKYFDKYLYDRRSELLTECSKELAEIVRRDDDDPERLANDQVSELQFWLKFEHIINKWDSASLKRFDEVAGMASIDCRVLLGGLEDSEEKEAQSSAGGGATAGGVSGSGAMAAPEKEEVVRHSFDTELARRTFREGLIKVAVKTQTDEYGKFRNFLGEKLSLLREDICRLFVTEAVPSKTLWTRVTDYVIEATNSLEAYYPVVDILLPKREEPDYAWLLDGKLDGRSKLALLISAILRDQFAQRVDWFPEYIHNRFKVFFEQDPSGVPYFWAGLSEDRIRAIYVEAKKKTEGLLGVITSFPVELNRLYPPGVPVSPFIASWFKKRLMSEAKEREIENFASRRMLKSCQEAQFIQATGGKPTAIPWYMYLITLLLGWNEIMACIRNPFFFMAISTLVALLAATWYTGNIARLINLSHTATSLGLGMLLPILQKWQNLNPNLLNPNLNALQAQQAQQAQQVMGQEQPTQHTQAGNYTETSHAQRRDNSRATSPVLTTESG